MGNNWEFSFYTDWREIEEQDFLDRWIKIMHEASSSHVFFHPSIAKAWVDAYRNKYDIDPVYVIAENDNAVIFLPLVLWKKNIKSGYIKVVVPVGYDIYDYHDPIIVGDIDSLLYDSYWNELINAIRDAKIKYDRIEINGGSRSVTCGGWKREEEVCPYTNLGAFADYVDFMDKRPVKLKRDINRRFRRYAELGDFELYVYGKDQQKEAMDALYGFLSVHRKRWPKSHETGVSEVVYELILRYGLDSGVSHFSELRMNQKAMSWHFGFRYNERFYYYMQAYEEEYIKLSPGKIHLALLYKDAFSAGDQIFDHLRGEEEYKDSWKSADRTLYEYSSNNSGLVSSVKLMASDVFRYSKESVKSGREVECYG
ncbi:MAG: GNAT family N-acetyltransferase [Chlorobium sp.]|uniref:GNAT family N-acetyltransferase n=1 Tax=Chlorobium sp. TaxID=1095 RepID=UPI0025B82B53|nr:GNAT family N-acetyltransferase [Chlorobium sp.]MCF8384017.1 GNAT family N-acetyltransferase [Chlorobium sp.]